MNFFGTGFLLCAASILLLLPASEKFLLFFFLLFWEITALSTDHLAKGPVGVFIWPALGGTAASRGNSVHGQAILFEWELFLLHAALLGNILSLSCSSLGLWASSTIMLANLVHPSGTVCVQASAGQPGGDFCVAKICS